MPETACWPEPEPYWMDCEWRKKPEDLSLKEE